MTEFSASQRQKNLQTIESTVFDLIVIGGGITGAAAAMNASSRGLKVALLERGDFACGTSSRSSKLIHGGFRYLQNLEFGLVYEALSERTRLLRSAPHLVRPIRFLMPVYAGGPVGLLKLRAGFWLYDLLSLWRAPQRHQFLDKSETIEKMPGLKSKGLLGSIEYSDATMDDDRLVIEVLRAANLNGAICLNYVEVKNFAESTDTNGLSSGVQLETQDKITGLALKIRGLAAIGALGPWTDSFASKSLSGWTPKLRPTKGVHIVLSPERLPVRKGVVIQDEKNRIIFVIPRDHFILVGTTDTDFQGPAENTKVESSDVTYLLDLLNSHFPGVQLTAKDVRASYSGVRPLVADGARSEGSTSREHSIFTDTPNRLTMIAGGKYTTFMPMAEQVVNQALKRAHIQAAPSKVQELLNPLISMASLRQTEGRVSLLRDSVTQTSDGELRGFLRDHGAEAPKMLDAAREFLGRQPSVAETLTLHAIRNEMCLRMKDFILRRSPYFLRNKDRGMTKISEVTAVWQKYFGISDLELKKEISDCVLAISDVQYYGE